MKGLYTLDELTDSIITEFGLKSEGNGAYEKYRQKVRRVLIDIGVWDNAKEYPVHGTKYKAKHFTEYDKQKLLSEKSLYNYVRKHSSQDHIKYGEGYDTVINNIASIKQEYYDQLALSDSDDERDRANGHMLQGLTREEILLRKIYYMIQALYDICLHSVDNTSQNPNAVSKSIDDEFQRILQLEPNDYFKDIFSLETFCDDIKDSYEDLSDDDKEEFRNRKMYMMIETLFSMYFTPINDGLLLYDLDRAVLNGDVEDMDGELYKAQKRLDHPEGNYFTRKQDK